MPLAQKTPVSPQSIGDRRERFRSQRTAHFTESVIREMTRLAVIHGAVNLAQGFPDFAAPEELKRAACDAVLARRGGVLQAFGVAGLQQFVGTTSELVKDFLGRILSSTGDALRSHLAYWLWRAKEEG